MTAYSYDATVVRAIDGDTIRLKLTKSWEHEVDFGFYITEKVVVSKSTERNIRLAGIDTPETRGRHADKVAGKAATVRLSELVALGPLRVVTSKPDKYGRWLGVLYVTTPTGEIDVNQTLVDEGFAVPYHGGKKTV